jgi:hypothetical protein
MDPTFFFIVLGLCIAVVNHLIPAISAFPLGPALTGLTVVSTFSYPGVPYQEGVRRVHTLEHLTSLNVSRRGCRLPYFDIHAVAPPRRFGDHVTIRVSCRVDGCNNTIIMIAKPEDPGSSAFMCVRDGVQLAVIRLRFIPTTYLDGGHRLTVTCVYPRGARALDRAMEPILRFMRFFRRLGQPDKEHANLQWYRRMVLGLEDSDREHV